jgi:hypothetical protein
MDFSYPPPLLRHRPGYFYGTGVHRMNGVLLAAGPGVPVARLQEPFSLREVTLTILEGMGALVPPTMSGRSFAARLGRRPN